MRKKGFTLIELMVVIAILAILAAIALTSYRAYIRKAKTKELVTFARACIQEAVAKCIENPNFTNFSNLESCSISDCSTQYMSSISVSVGEGSTCDSLTVQASGIPEGGSTPYTATCSYNSTTEDVTCSSPTPTSS